METIIQQSIQLIRDKFATDHNVALILLVGSAARGTADKFSDIDIYVVLNQQPSSQSETIDLNETQIEILYDSVKDVEKYLSSEYGVLYRNVSSMLVGSKYILGDKKLSDKLVAIATDNIDSKTSLDPTVVKQYIASARDFLDDMRRYYTDDTRVEYMLSQKQFLDAIMPLLVVNAGTYMQKPNLLVEWFRANNPHIYGLLEAISKNNNPLSHEQLLNIAKQ